MSLGAHIREGPLAKAANMGIVSIVMKTFFRLPVAALAGIVFASAALSSAHAGEDIAVSELPEAVTKAIEQKHPGSTLLAAEKDKEKGQKVYEVKIRDGSVQRKLDVNIEGEILKTEVDD